MLSEAMAILRDAVPILAGNPTPVAERARVQALAELFLHNIRHEPDGGKIAPRPENQPKHS